MIAQPGLLLEGGHYKLVSRIAVGGMGEVWRAHDMVAGIPVAVKVLRPEYTDDEVSLKRLRFEARNAAMLNHPNITQVLDYGEVDGTGYIVMEYVDGKSLADVLATHSTIGPLRLLPILIQASLGLHAAHSVGVVHRDVKPGNILLGHADHVKLTDFGISVAHGQLPLTDVGKVMGTAQYLAPEQALGNPATPAGDLYSLGVIAYEALVGERPFRGANYVAIALAQVNEKPPPLPASVEKSLATLVMRLMEKSPARRPADGAELAGLFRETLDIHRALVSRLLATRRGGGDPVRADATASPTTAEQPVLDSRAIMPPEAPQTAMSATIAPHPEAPEAPVTEPTLVTPPASPPASPPEPPPTSPPEPVRPPSRRLRVPDAPPQIAQALPIAPPVPSREELTGRPAPAVPTTPTARPVAGAGVTPYLQQPRRRDEVPAPQHVLPTVDTPSGTSTPRPTQPVARRRSWWGAGLVRWSREWWAALLAAFGLFLIILIGLLTTIYADMSLVVTAPTAALFRSLRPTAIMFASAPPTAAQPRER
ncbi:MAG: protein kinase [Bifidobacteriaceae bacterium]|nr:protein kinase [Bifidobacteriaceae bacterium]